MYVKVDYSVEAKKNPRPNMAGEYAVYTKKHWWNKWVERQNHAKVKDITFQCHCYYVNELQHALRLTGVEKEVVV